MDKDYVMREWFKIVLLMVIIGILLHATILLTDIKEDRIMRVTETKTYHTYKIQNQWGDLSFPEGTRVIKDGSRMEE